MYLRDDVTFHLNKTKTKAIAFLYGEITYQTCDEKKRAKLIRDLYFIQSSHLYRFRSLSFLPDPYVKCSFCNITIFEIQHELLVVCFAIQRDDKFRMSL